MGGNFLPYEFSWRIVVSLTCPLAGQELSLFLQLLQGFGSQALSLHREGWMVGCYIFPRFNCMTNCFSDEFPLLTTKRVFWKGVLEELLWFIKVRVVLLLEAVSFHNPSLRMAAVSHSHFSGSFSSSVYSLPLSCSPH